MLLNYMGENRTLDNILNEVAPLLHECKTIDDSSSQYDTWTNNILTTVLPFEETSHSL